MQFPFQNDEALRLLFTGVARIKPDCVGFERHVLRDHALFPNECDPDESGVADFEWRDRDLLALDPGADVVDHPGNVRLILEALIEVAIGFVAQEFDAIRAVVRVGHPDPGGGDEVLVRLRFCCANPDMVKRAGSPAALRHSCPQSMRLAAYATGRSPQSRATARSTLTCSFSCPSVLGGWAGFRARRRESREFGRKLEAVGIGLDLVMIEVVGAGDIVVLDHVPSRDVLGDLADRLDGVEEELPGGLSVPAPALPLGEVAAEALASCCIDSTAT